MPVFQPSKTPQPLWKGRAVRAIHAELTDKCNSACPMCPRYINNGAAVNPLLSRTEVSLEQFKAWFDPEFVRSLIKFLACGNYGDPIMARDTLEIYRYLRETNPEIGLAMNTNGSARSKEWWAEMGKLIHEKNRGDYCTFSVDGLADTSALYRRNTDFHKVMENAAAFIEAGGEAHWDYIVFDYNEHQVSDARKLALEMGFTNFNVKRTTRWHIYKEERGEFAVKDKNDQVTHVLRQPLSSQFKDETMKVLQENLQKPNYVTAQEFDKLYHDDTHLVSFDRWGKDIKINHSEIEISCRSVQGESNSLDEFFLSATGHVFPCCFLGGEPWRYDAHNGPSKDNFMKMVELNGGMDSIDLKKTSLSAILQSPLYAEMIRRSFEKSHSMRSKQCSTCCGKNWNKLDYGELGDKKKGMLGLKRLLHEAFSR